MKATCEQDEFSDVEYNEDNYDDDDEEELSDSEMEELSKMVENLKPYQFEPEIDGSDEDIDQYESEESNDNINVESRIGKTGWCSCGKCRVEGREIDCLCCREVQNIREKQFDGNVCITEAKEFGTLCLEASVLKNVLVALHETKGDSFQIKK